MVKRPTPTENSNKITIRGKQNLEQGTASKVLEKEVPISGVDQFGSLDKYLKPQLVSRPTK
jgi:hypothetical protein